jgi:hypothetical protein
MSQLYYDLNQISPAVIDGGVGTDEPVAPVEDMNTAVAETDSPSQLLDGDHIITTVNDGEVGNDDETVTVMTIDNRSLTRYYIIICKKKEESSSSTRRMKNPLPHE